MTKPHRIPLSSRRIEISLLANRAVLSRHAADWLAAEFGGDKTSFCRSGLAEGNGELSPGEAASLVQMVEAHTRVLLVSDFEQRLTKLEVENK